MKVAALARRALTMPRAERRLLAAAWLIHARISGAALFRPIRRLAADAADTRPRQGPRVDPAALVRAVAVTSRWSPWRSVCLHRALTLTVLLRRHSQSPVLHYGIATPGRGFGAHMWVTLDGRILIGGETRAGHLCVAHFPADAASGAECPA